MIRFNKPYCDNKEAEYLQDVIRQGRLAGGGVYTTQCQHFFEQLLGVEKVLLTTSGTAALEMSAILLDIQPGDEVIMPSYTFVSTANAFVLRGAKIVFADCRGDYPNVDLACIEALLSERTKAVVVVHYGGVACDMDRLQELSDRHMFHVIEDAAQAVDSFYNSKPLGSFGTFAAFSFHETKNLTCGEGGMLVINDRSYIDRAEVIWEKGTNRVAFQQGRVNKYSWYDVGSSFLPSELNAAVLLAQCEKLQDIQDKRKAIWQNYRELIEPIANEALLELQRLPEGATVNGSLFYILTSDLNQRNKLIDHNFSQGICTPFHYLSLHRSPYFAPRHDGRELPKTDRYSDCLLRLPLYCGLLEEEVEKIVASLKKFYRK